MRSLLKKKWFNGILLLTIIGEFLVPWLLKFFYEGYNGKKMVMSALGSPESPVRACYNAWLIWLGIFLVVTCLAWYLDKKAISKPIAGVTASLILIFAIGAGLVAGIFSVNESKEVVTLASTVHGVGAAIGFMALLFFPLFNGILAFKAQDKAQGIVNIFAFIFAFIFFICFIMGDKEQFQNTILAYEGIWERVSLLCMYIPFIYQSLHALIKK